jgi:DNA recombination protein RmuC
MTEFVPYLTLGCSAIALLLALLVLLGFGRRPPANDPALTRRFDELAATVRNEADRARNDTSEQTRGVRQEIGQRLDVGIEAIRSLITDIGLKLNADIAYMERNAGESRELLRSTVENKLDGFGDRQANSARDLRTDLFESFTRTADVLSQTTKDLSAQQQERLEKVALELNGMADRQSAAQETLRLAVEGRLDAIRSENAVKLEEMRNTVDEKLQATLDQRISDSFRTVSEQLERVHLGLGEMQVLANGVGDLKRVLSNVKIRGTFAEAQLGSLLEQFLTPDQFQKNAQIKPHSAERVEFAIKFVGRDSDQPLLLPIDAKFPREDYERLVQAADRADVEGVEAASIALERSIKTFAKSISDKYIDPPTTTDFAILFLPTESLFAEALRRPGLHDQLLRDHRVMIAGPTTLSSMLSAFQMGFRSLAIQERSSEVWKILGAVRTEFAEHGKVVMKLQRQLGTASKTIDELGTRTKVMNRKLKDVETLPGVDALKVLGLTNAALASAEDEDEEEMRAREEADKGPRLL